METRQLTCIGCPMGCQLTVTFEPGNRDSVKVTGNTCKRGELYAVDEVTNPTRTVTGTVKLKNRHMKVAPVKTATPVPKDKIFDVAEEMMKIVEGIIIWIRTSENKKFLPGKFRRPKA